MHALQDYGISSVLLSLILFASVVGAVLVAAALVAIQISIEARNLAKLRRLKYVKNAKWVECCELRDPQAYHLFLSHAWPAAQDRMRIVKERFLEACPSMRVFLDVDNLKSGSGTAEVDRSECILVFCTLNYFNKNNSLKELYRAVVQRRPILAMLEPDSSQEGGLNSEAIKGLVTNAKLAKFKKKWAQCADEGELLPGAFDHAPNEEEMRTALFASEPVEWNRLPHFQDVTIRLIAQRGVLGGKSGELYLQGEAATGAVVLQPPLAGRKYHLFCSPLNMGAAETAEELMRSDVWVMAGTKPRQRSATLTWTSDISELDACDHMLLVLDSRTWASGADTAGMIEDIHAAMRYGVHIICVHEFPSVVGPTRNQCEFGLMFNDDWTPLHLTTGASNLYKEIAIALKAVEWRKPGLVALASKIASSATEHTPIDMKVPDAYIPKRGPNRYKFSSEKTTTIERILGTVDSDRKYVTSAAELHTLLSRAIPTLMEEESSQIYSGMLADGYDTDGDGQISMEEAAAYFAQSNLGLEAMMPSGYSANAATPVHGSSAALSISLVKTLKDFTGSGKMVTEEMGGVNDDNSTHSDAPKATLTKGTPFVLRNASTDAGVEQSSDTQSPSSPLFSMMAAGWQSAAASMTPPRRLSPKDGQASPPSATLANLLQAGDGAHDTSRDRQAEMRKQKALELRGRAAELRRVLRNPDTLGAADSLAAGVAPVTGKEADLNV